MCIGQVMHQVLKIEVRATKSDFATHFDQNHELPA